MTNPKGWHLITATNVNPVLTIADLMAVTGLSRWTIRGMLIRYQISPLPRYGPRDTIRYQRQQVMTAIAAMPGSGRRSTQP